MSACLLCLSVVIIVILASSSSSSVTFLAHIFVNVSATLNTGDMDDVGSASDGASSSADAAGSSESAAEHCSHCAAASTSSLIHPSLSELEEPQWEDEHHDPRINWSVYLWQMGGNAAIRADETTCQRMDCIDEPAKDWAWSYVCQKARVRSFLWAWYYVYQTSRFNQNTWHRIVQMVLRKHEQLRPILLPEARFLEAQRWRPLARSVRGLTPRRIHWRPIGGCECR